MKPISVYALNLPKRQDRLRSILQQFRGKSEFDFKVISVIQHKIGAYGQWRNFNPNRSLGCDESPDGATELQAGV